MKTVQISNTSNKKNRQAINVEISEIVLTPFACASLINEILKGLLYQKSQIPYPYTWLKSIVNKKREQRDEPENCSQTNFKLLNHFRIVSNAFDIMERLMKGIIKEFSVTSELVAEVIIIFGTTPECPKEIFSISTIPVIEGHSERNHMAQLHKFQQKILRRIFLSQDWMDNMDNSLACTNMYVFMKKCVYENVEKNTNEDDIFKVVTPLNVPNSVKHVAINLLSINNVESNCCDNLSIFSDTTDGKVNFDQAINNQHTQFVWYQSKDLFKGFKDCYINKIAASELW